MGVITQDMRYGMRVLRKNPGFALASILILAVGIGANTAIFSLVNAVLLRQLPFKNSDQLVWIWARRVDRDKAFFSIPDFIDFRDRNQTLEQIVAFGNWGANLTDRGDPERFLGARISANAFQMLGINAVVGRTLLPEDDLPGSPRVVVLSYGLWQRRFAGEWPMSTNTLTLNGDSYTVLGVLPPDFVLPGTDAELAIPLSPETDPRRTERGANFLRAFGRLKPGFTPQQAQSDLDVIALDLQRLYPDTNAKKITPRVLPLFQEIVGTYNVALMMLLGAVGLVLLIACLNLANLMLARASARHKELAIRAAMGATRRRLIQLVLTESFLIALPGGVLGLLLAYWGLKFLIALSPANLPRANEINIDGRVLAFTLAVSLLSGLIFGLLPGIQASKVNLNNELKAEGRGTTGSRLSNRTRNLLVVSEVALSLILLINAGLLAKSFLRIQEVSAGFDTDKLLLVRLSLPQARYKDRDSVKIFYDNVSRRVGELDGVKSVSLANVLPLSGMNVRSEFSIVGRPPLSPTDMPASQSRWVSPGYFETMQIPLKRGRDFTEYDNERSREVVVIDEALAERYWPGEDPIGTHLRVTYDGEPAPREVEVIGIVGNVKHVGLDDEPTATFYAPFLQIPEHSVSFFTVNMSLTIRTASEPLALATLVRQEVKAVDKDVPASNIRTMDQFLSASVAPRRFNVQLLTIFAVTALLLAIIGIYAVISYSVANRTQEIGIRMALGARPLDVLKLVVGHGLKLVIIGVLVGLAGAYVLTRAVSALLFGVGSADLATFAITPLALMIVALVACYIPARRAARVDPANALRAQ